MKINMNEHCNNDAEFDSLADEITDVLNEVESIVPSCPNEGIARDLQLVFQNQAQRQALVRLYSVLLEVDMRNNPESYRSQK